MEMKQSIAVCGPPFTRLVSQFAVWSLELGGGTRARGRPRQCKRANLGRFVRHSLQSVCYRLCAA